MQLSIKTKPFVATIKAEIKEGQYILSIADGSSKLPVLDLKLDRHQLTSLLTGSSTGEATLHSTAKFLGKSVVSEGRKTQYPGNAFDDRGLISRWLLEHKQEEGWFIDANVNFHHSVENYGHQTLINYRVFKFV